VARRFARYFRCSAVLFGLSAALSLAGCQNGDDPKPSGAGSEEHASSEAAEHASNEPGAPETFAAGVAELKKHYTEIKTAFAETDTSKAAEMAHGPLHGMRHLLGILPGLVDKAELSAEELAAVNGAITTMAESYGTIDGAMHHGETPDYAAESEKLDEAMAAIEAVCGQPEEE
jgi:hypothetical protein